MFSGVDLHSKSPLINYGIFENNIIQCCDRAFISEMDKYDKDSEEENSHLNVANQVQHSSNETCDISVIRLNDMSTDTDIMTNNGAAKYNSSNVDGVRNREIVADGLLKYAPKCCQNALLSIYGLLFFLSWASTIQVSHRLRGLFL